MTHPRTEPALDARSLPLPGAGLAPIKLMISVIDRSTDVRSNSKSALLDANRLLQTCRGFLSNSSHSWRILCRLPHSTIIRKNNDSSPRKFVSTVYLSAETVAAVASYRLMSTEHEQQLWSLHLATKLGASGACRRIALQPACFYFDRGSTKRYGSGKPRSGSNALKQREGEQAIRQGWIRCGAIVG